MRISMPSPWMLPSPSPWRVGVRIETFEACSSFTRVAAGRIAQPPMATFVARLQPGQLPAQTARQLPDPSTLIRVEPSSTRETRPQGAHGDMIRVELIAAERPRSVTQPDIVRCSSCRLGAGFYGRQALSFRMIALLPVFLLTASRAPADAHTPPSLTAAS